MLYHDVMNARNPVGTRVAAAEVMIKEYKDFAEAVRAMRFEIPDLVFSYCKEVSR